MDYDSIIYFIETNKSNIILLFPIGPPGSGKTTLKNLLINKIKDRIVIAPSRDDIYKKYRVNNGIKKTRHLTHNEMVNSVKNLDSNNKYLIYIDSTNSNCGIRIHYINLINPDIVRNICFHTKHLDNPIDYLLNRIIGRFHPTFPIDKDEKIKIINTIINSIDYPLINNFNIYI